MKRFYFAMCIVGLKVLFGCASASDVNDEIHGPEVAYLPRHFTYKRVTLASSGNTVYQSSRNRDNIYLSITGFQGNFTSVIIPVEINGSRVIAIDYEAFQEKKLTSVTLTNDLIIDNRAFRNNELAEIIIPSGVRIGAGAFAGNNLNNIIFSDGVKTIGVEAFARNNLTEVIIPDSVISIGAETFNDNILDSIIIPFELFINRGIALNAFGKNEINNITFKDGTSISFLHFIQALSIMEESKVLEQQARNSELLHHSNLITYRNNPTMLADIKREYEQRVAERMQEWDRKALELALLLNSIGISW